MYNNQSPMMNNQYGYIPPNPIGGNIVGIGNNGYMGGYYNNCYNNYYNPYLAMKQRELEEARMREQQRKQSSLMINISKAVNGALDNDIDEEFLKERWEPQEIRKLNEGELEEQKTYQLINLCTNEQSYHNIANEQFTAYSNMIYDKNKERFPDNTSLYDYLAKGHELYNEIIDQRLRQSQRNLSKLYNSKQYNELIKSHSKDTYFDSVFGNNRGVENVNLDDMEIKLPNHLQDEYNERRKKFLESIFNK